MKITAIKEATTTLSLLFFTCMSADAQSHWENNDTLPQTWTGGSVGIGTTSAPGGVKLHITTSDATVHTGIYLQNHSGISDAHKYGVRVSLNNAANTVNNYGVYADVPSGSNYWAGYFRGNGFFSGTLALGAPAGWAATEKLEVFDGNIVLGGLYNKFVLHHQWWNSADPAFYMAPWSATLNDWDFEKGITMNKNGWVKMQSISLTDTLKVQQKIWARSVEVKLPPFPDYVFEPVYELVPLDSVSAFITANGHLPGLPSAAMIDAAEGYDVGALLIKQLEKIEELTLYVIELKTEIDRLKKAEIQHSGQH